MDNPSDMKNLANMLERVERRIRDTNDALADLHFERLSIKLQMERAMLTARKEATDEPA